MLPTKILFNKPIAVGYPVIHKPTKCLHNCLWVRSRPSLPAVNRLFSKCLGRAPSARASSCILAAISWAPSSIMALIIKPDPFTIAKEGCWNNLNNDLPLAATISNKWSKCLPSVVSLYGTHKAKVKRSSMAETTRAPVPWFWKSDSRRIIRKVKEVQKKLINNGI